MTEDDKQTLKKQMHDARADFDNSMNQLAENGVKTEQKTMHDARADFDNAMTQLAENGLGAEQTHAVSDKQVMSSINQASSQLTKQLEQYYQPTDDLNTTLRKDDMVEKLSSIQKNIAILSVYKDLKNKGVDEITSNDGTLPLEALFSEKEDLLEIASRPDFSLDNPEIMKSIVEYSVDNSEPVKETLSTIKTRPQKFETTQPQKNSSDFDRQTEALLQNTISTPNASFDLTSYMEQISPMTQEEAATKSDHLVNRLQKELTKTSNAPDMVLLSAGASIGDLDAKKIFSSRYEEQPDNDLTFDKPHQQMKSKDIQYVQEQGNTLAYQRDGTIFINKQPHSQEELDATKKAVLEKGLEPNLLTEEFLKGNNIAQQIIALHETCHLTQEKKVGLQNAEDSPTNVLKLNTLTEKSAYSTEFLAIANMHANLKKQGVNVLSYTDNEGLKEMPVDKLLELCPGLKEAVKDGFSADNPQDVRKVVEVAAKQWDERMSESYKEQACRTALKAANKNPSFSAQVERHKTPKEIDFDQKYEKDAQTMLKDVYIGGNVSVDLTHCRDLLDTGKPEEILNLGKSNEFPEAQQILTTTPETKKAQMLDKDTLFKINDYLEQQGIKGDKEKDEYIQEGFKAIVTRSTDASKYDGLKNILLENGGTVKYADGMTETHTPNAKTIDYQLSSEPNYTLSLPADSQNKTNTNKKDDMLAAMIAKKALSR